MGGGRIIPAEHSPYVSHDDGTINVINTANGSIVGNISISNYYAAADLAVNPAGTLLYVPNAANGTVSVVSTATNALVATITIPSHAGDGGYNEVFGVPLMAATHFLSPLPDGWHGLCSKCWR